MYVYAFTAIVIDSSEWMETHTIKHFRESGFGLADSLSQAAAQLEKRYGDDLESLVRLQFFGDEEDIIIVSEDTIKDYAHADYGEYQVPCDIDGEPTWREVPAND